MRRRKTASRKVASAPDAADSLGVARPTKITPTTMKMMKPTGITCIAAARSFTDHGIRSTSKAGATSGSITQRPTM